MPNLKSVYLVSYGAMLTGERIYEHTSSAIFAIEKSKIFKGLGKLPCFYNGKSVSSRAAVVRLLAAEKGKRTFVKMQWCMSEKEGFERCIAVQTFKSRVAFERSIYCRKSASYTRSQALVFPMLTTGA